MAIELRPLRAGELLDATFSLYRRHFLLFVSLTAIPYLLVLPINLVQAARTTRAFDWSPAGLLLMAAGWLASLIAFAAAQSATFAAISHVYLGRPATVAGSFSQVRGRILAVAGIGFCVGVAILLGCVLLIVPGVLLAVMWALTIPAAVLEGKSLVKATARSAELTKGHRGRVFLLGALFVLLIWIVSIILNLPVVVATFVVAMKAATPAAVALPPWLLVLTLLNSFVSNSLLWPLMLILLGLLYYDLRVRKEAFDLQLLMTEIDGATPSAPGSL